MNPVFGESNSFPPTWWLLERYIGVNSLTIPDIGKQVRTQARPRACLAVGLYYNHPNPGQGLRMLAELEINPAELIVKRDGALKRFRA